MPKSLWTDWKKDDTDAILNQEYKDAGDWARHYSNVRMTTGTFFLTAATAMIYVRWDSPQLAISLFAAAFLAIGGGIFVTFSFLTLNQMNKQLAIANSYRLAMGKSGISKQYNRLFYWNSLPLAAILLIFFGLFESWWLNHPTPVSAKTFAAKVPITLQVANQPAAVMEIPVKITVP